MARTRDTEAAQQRMGKVEWERISGRVTNRVSFQISLPEEVYVEIAKKGNTPSAYIEQLIIDTHAVIHDRKITPSSIGEYGNGPILMDQPSQDGWTKEKMHSFIDYLTQATRERSDITVLLAMLAAYAECGTNRPSTADLRQARGLQDVPNEIWNQELRTSKSRITITAKHLEHPKMFTSAYGKGKKRIHPINPECFEALVEWKENETKPTAADQTGLLASERFEDLLKTASPYHVPTSTS